MNKQPDPFYIRISHRASALSPEQAISTLQDHADRLGIPCEAEVNGFTCTARPNMCWVDRISEDLRTVDSVPSRWMKPDGRHDEAKG